MGEPSSATELLPISWQIAIGATVFSTTVGGIVWKFLKSLKGYDPQSQHDHVILERADLVDMHALRDLIRELRPVLERLVHVDAITTHTSYQIKEVIQRMDRMEQGAQMAKEVRDEIARTLEKERSQYRRQGNRRDEN